MTDEPDAGAQAVARRMFDLARKGDVEQLVGYIDAGLPVNTTNPAGDTLLILAAYYDHPETVRALLERGADTSVVNGRGQTALAAAVFRHSPAAALLVRAGADPDLGSPSAVATARFFDLPDMLALLESRPSA